MFCPNCGRDVGNSNFCSECGFKISKNDFSITNDHDEATFSDEIIISANDSVENQVNKNLEYLEKDNVEDEEIISKTTLKKQTNEDIDNKHPVITKQAKGKGYLLYVAIGLILITGLIIALIVRPKYVTNKTIKVNFGQDQIFSGLYTGNIKANKPNGTGKFSTETQNGTYYYDGIWEKGTPVGKFTVSNYEMIIEFEGKKLKGVYSGEVEKSIPDGKGNFSYEQDDDYFKYSGNWANSKPLGIGNVKSNFFVVHFDDVDRTGTFDGEVKNMIPFGKGEFSAINDKNNPYTYSGEWDDGTFNGQGIMKIQLDNGKTQNREGTFVNGYYKPNVFEMYRFIGENHTETNSNYTIIEKAEKFLKKYPEIFEKNSVNNYKGETVTSFSFKDFSKNQSSYGDKLVKTKLTIVQIEEFKLFGDGQKLSFIIAEDKNGYVYSGYMYNYSKNIYEGSSVTGTFLPLAYFSYPNISNTYTRAVACAFVSIK